MRPLEGKVVLITGASRGLGVDIAKGFARKRARLALAARSADELEKVRGEIEEMGASAVAIPADVGDVASLRALVANTEASLGPIDVLVNNAGLEHVFDFESESPDRIGSMVGVNVTGLLQLTRLVVPSMIARRSGHICNIASLAGLVPVPHNSVYSATKHAVVGASRSLRIELREHGVEVSCVCPGFVEGGMFLEWGRPAPKISGSVTPQQVAAAVLSAVERNRGEVVVTKGLGKVGSWFEAMAPETSAKLMRRTGVLAFLEEQAEINSKRD